LGISDLAENWAKCRVKDDISSMQQRELDWGNADREMTERRDTLRGDVIFASAEEQSQRCTELLGEGALLVTLPPPSSDARGRLGDVLEELVERELARQGAPSPYLAAWCAMPEDAQARLADQLFRARSVGASGLAIALGSLRAIAFPELSPDDSATLRWLAETSDVAPLVLLIDDADLQLLGHRAPVSLGVLLGKQTPAWTAPPSSEIPVVEEIEVEEIEVEEIEVEAVVAPTPPEPAPPELAPAPAAEVAPLSPAGRSQRGRRASAGVPVSGPSDAWRSWAIAISATRGAQSLAAFERLFAESYVPLANAIANGLDDPRALRAYEEFRHSFERSYSEAFATFGLTNRRPRLVMDAYDLASKQARLGSARSAHVLLVDSMRFDLGCLVRDALGRETTGLATLTSETVVWSALPTTTMRQIETFARGLDALREPSREEPSESLRGRAAEVVRRMRIGSRELYKLDLIPSLLEGTDDVIASLGNIANATAEAIARHVSTLPPRTLLFVVGDHGFTLDRRGQVRTGGASPEEVLVPAYSWLVGELH
jgi:hypothetical protein